MPKIKLNGEKWKYRVGRGNIVIKSPDGEEFVASKEEIIGNPFNNMPNGCYVTKDDVRNYIERELI